MSDGRGNRNAVGGSRAAIPERKAGHNSKTSSMKWFDTKAIPEAQEPKTAAANGKISKPVRVVAPESRIKFSLFNLTKSRVAGKTFQIVNGVLVKRTEGAVSASQVRVVSVSSLDGFCRYLKDKLSVPGKSILAYGLPHLTDEMRAQKAVIVYSAQRFAKLKADAQSLALQRNEETFFWRDGPGIMFIDVDYRTGDVVELPAANAKHILSSAPGLRGHDMASGYSSGGWIFDTATGKQLVGLRGQRFYFAVKDARDIPRATRVLVKRLWLRGKGYILVGQNGSLHVRSLIDPTVWQASRLDYVAGAVCGKGLEQRRPDPCLICRGKRLVDTKAALPDLTAAEEQRYEALVTAAKAAKADEVEEKLAASVRAQLTSRVRIDLGGDASDEAVGLAVAAAIAAGAEQEIRQALTSEREMLPADFVITLKAGRQVKVWELISRPQAYEGKACLDPYEPGYDGGRATAIIYAGNRRIVSQAHGTGRVFILGSDFEAIDAWAVRKEDVQRDWQQHLATVTNAQDLLADEVILTALLLEGHEEAEAAIEALAKRRRVTTKFKAAKDAMRARFLRTASTGETGKVRIMLDDANTYDLVSRQIVEVLARKQLVFDMGGLFVAPKRSADISQKVRKRDETGNVILDGSGKPVMEPYVIVQARIVDSGKLIALAGEEVALFRPGDEGPVACGIPGSILTRILSHYLDTAVPPLLAFADHPVWFKDDLLTGNGYHEESGLFLATGYIDVEDFTDVKEALDFLLSEWLGDLPFASDKDKASALMFLMTLLCGKTSLMGVGRPMVLFSATTAGIGKSLIVDLLHYAVTGKGAPTTPLPEDGQERKKLMMSVVMANTLSLNFDNLRTGSTFGNHLPEILQAITSGRWSDRVLGGSNAFDGPVGFVMSATGNAIGVAGDMRSRLYECRLERPGGQNLATRKFRHKNIIQWTKENRGRILGAIRRIMLVKTTVEVAGRFPQWANVVANPVVSAMGLKEWDADWIDAAESDGEGTTGAGMADLFTAIACLPLFGTTNEDQPPEGHWYTAAEIREGVAGHVLRAAFFGDMPTVEAVAIYLKKNRGTTVEGRLRLEWNRFKLGGNRTNRMKRGVFKIIRTGELPKDGREKLLNGGEFSPVDDDEK